MLQRRAERGESVPALDNQPEVSAAEHGYLLAYNAASRTRPQAMDGLGPILASDLMLWLSINGIMEPDEVLLYHEIVTQLDLAYRNWVHEELERTRPKPVNRSPR